MCINFFGIQPTLTQVPPRPHLEPAGEGFTKSNKQTRNSGLIVTASLAHAKPPEPPPMTIKS